MNIRRASTLSPSVHSVWIIVTFALTCANLVRFSQASNKDRYDRRQSNRLQNTRLASVPTSGNINGDVLNNHSIHYQNRGSSNDGLETNDIDTVGAQNASDVESTNSKSNHHSPLYNSSLLKLRAHVPSHKRIRGIEQSGVGSFCRTSSCTKHHSNGMNGVRPPRYSGSPQGLPQYLANVPRCGAAHESKSHTQHSFRALSSEGGEIIAKKKGQTASAPNNKSKFPLLKSEIPRFISMSTMMFLFIYVYTTARDTKDTLVVSNCGAEAIPFLKMYGVMPCAFLFIICYSKLSQFLDKKALFYATLLPFFGFYASFAFFLYPNRESLHFVSTGGGNEVGSAALSLIRYWSFSLYFIISELWASAGVPLLFWQVANDITTVSQAKRFYPLFAVTGNLAPIISGKVMHYIVSKHPADGEGFGATLKSLAIVKVVCGAAIVLLYNFIYMGADSDESGSEKKVLKEAKTSSPKKASRPSLSESIAELSKSSELRSLAAMVLGYNVCVELTEVLWKGILRKTHTSESAYMSFMAAFSQKVGIIAIILQLTASTIIKKLGWTKASQLTPLAMLLLAIPFFVAVAISKTYPNTIPLTTALTIGTWQNIVNKIVKYSLFDPLKEMAYIPLPPDAKIKGKAAIDVLGARLGRSLASGTQQILVLLSSGNIIECAPYLAGIYCGTIALWLSAVRVLGKMFETKHGDIKDRKE